MVRGESPRLRVQMRRMQEQKILQVEEEKEVVIMATVEDVEPMYESQCGRIRITLDDGSRVSFMLDKYELKCLLSVCEDVLMELELNS